MCEISVIVPVYNVDKYLNKCLYSLLAQTIISKMEIILIDDGSTDSCGQICDEYADLHEAVRVFHQQNQGVSTARNTGLSKASGEYIAFVDADDFVEPWYFERMLTLAKVENADLIVFDYWLDFTDGTIMKYRKKTGTRIWNQKEALKEFLSGGTIGVNLFDKIFRRDLLRELRFDDQIRIGEDLFFIFQFLLNVQNVCGNFTPGYHYFQREGSAMHISFGDKYFDVIEVSDRINRVISCHYPDLIPYARALYIHSEYKTLERAYKFKDYDSYQQKLEEMKCDLRNYRFRDACRYLSFKQFAGFCLMRVSPKIYIALCRIMKI